MSRYQFAILGAGAIGSILGAHLARGGHSVVMLARERRAQQILRDGLRISGLSQFAVQVPVLSDPTQLQEAEVFIVAMKTPGTAAALQPLSNAVFGSVFSIQNGLWKNELLAQTFGASRVLGALANTSGELLPTGEVQFTRNVNLAVGELTGKLSSRAETVAHALDSSGVRASAAPDILRREWTKFAAWVGLMSLSVTTRTATWRYLSDPHCARVLVRLVREVAELAKAAGFPLLDDATLLPLTAILYATEQEAIDAVMTVGQYFKSSAPDHRMSSLQDLQAGRALEVEETLGYAARRALELSLSLPLLDAFYHLVAGIDAARG